MSIEIVSEAEALLGRVLKQTTDALLATTAERDALIAELGQPVPLSEWQQMVSERDALRDALEDALEALENEGPVFWQEMQDKARAVLKGKS